MKIKTVILISVAFNCPANDLKLHSVLVAGPRSAIYKFIFKGTCITTELF